MNTLSHKGWTVLKVWVGIVTLVFVILVFTVFGEQQSDGSYVTIRAPFTIFLGYSALFCAFLLILAEVRKRTGELSVKTFFLTALWLGGIALLLTVTSLFRN